MADAQIKALRAQEKSLRDSAFWAAPGVRFVLEADAHALAQRIFRLELAALGRANNGPADPLSESGDNGSDPGHRS